MSMNIGAKDIALLFCLGFCFGSAPASAKTPETTVFSATPVERIFQSRGESWDMYITRVARYLRDFTAQTGFEAGGWLCVNPGTGLGAISVITAHSQIHVPAGMRGCQNGGYEASKEFIHSHPDKKFITLREEDFVGASHISEMKKYGMRPGKTVFVGASGGRFSSFDLIVVPGYLVHKNNLYYQNNSRQVLVRNLQSDDLGYSVRRPATTTNFGGPHRSWAPN